MLPRNSGSHHQATFCCNPSWHVGSWSHQHKDWRVRTSGWPLVWIARVEVCRRKWSYILRRLRTTTQSLIALETDRPVTIPNARGQTWLGRDACSGLTQPEKIRESLTCIHLCSGSPAGRWWMPCSYRLVAAQWQRSCTLAFSWSKLGRGSSSATFLLPRPEKGVSWPIPRWTHPARVAVVARVVIGLVHICSKYPTGRAMREHLSAVILSMRSCCETWEQHLWMK